MPELIEVERYRQLAAARALDRVVTEVAAPDAWFLKGGLDADTLRSAVEGRSFVAARRIGKLLLLELSAGGPTVGLRFGMTGRLLVDGAAGVDDLEYSSMRDEPAWDRVGFHFGDDGSMVVRDPRRLGGVLLEPDEGRLGVEAGTVTLGQLRAVLGRSVAPLKARLLDQGRLAGIGNLLADETLWRAGLDPARPAGGLDEAELRRLQRGLRATVAELTEAGGSHTGRLQSQRYDGGRCPRCHGSLQRRTVGGRTTYSCPRHQR